MRFSNFSKELKGLSHSVLLSFLTSMHNFHRAKPSRSSREPWRWQPPSPSGENIPQDDQEDPPEGDESDIEVEDDEEEVVASSVSSAERLSPSSSSSLVHHLTHHFHDWSSEISEEQAARRQRKGNNSILFFAKASLLPSRPPSADSLENDREGDGVILLRFRGQAFLLQ
jgi:hypothetical protein